MMVSESILTELRFLLVALLSGAAMILFYDLAVLCVVRVCHALPGK